MVTNNSSETNKHYCKSYLCERPAEWEASKPDENDRTKMVSLHLCEAHAQQLERFGSKKWKFVRI